MNNVIDITKCGVCGTCGATVCPFSPVKKNLLIACARKQPLTLEGCHFAH